MIEETTTKTITCKNCGSEAIVKFGSYKGVQRYFCKSCNRKFKADADVFHMKVPAEYVSSAKITKTALTRIRQPNKDSNRLSVS